MTQDNFLDGTRSSPKRMKFQIRAKIIELEEQFFGGWSEVGQFSKRRAVGRRRRFKSPFGMHRV